MTSSSKSDKSASSPSPDTRSDDGANVEHDVEATEQVAQASEHQDGGSEPDTDKTKTTADASSSSSPPPVSESAQGTWQAIWSPSHNAYYFYNAATQETTWTNPLQPSTPEAADTTPTPSDPSEPPVASSSSATPSQLSRMRELQAAALAQGIDPSLAYLDPSLVSGPAVEGYAAKFNARTGTFTRPDGRDPSHLSEYERAKRMSEFYFDVNKWQEDTAADREAEEAEGKKRKRPTKKDLERFKEQKKAKKIAKTAWLRT
ncbi:hypothetical protein EUX98_g2373 [Antrodiella citrinella]|uniref:WW domain-containing protein n=1 Tax=Antrodiella citrinella TaxID=2447956 RepID=A0A4S4N7G6_9APHY|nr:hypothetical protein EUX98_g2373 [Antrodiella citrinella]